MTKSKSKRHRELPANEVLNDVWLESSLRGSKRTRQFVKMPLRPENNDNSVSNSPLTNLSQSDSNANLFDVEEPEVIHHDLGNLPIRSKVG